MRYSFILKNPISLSSLQLMFEHFKSECETLQNINDAYHLNVLQAIYQDLLLGKGRVMVWKKDKQTQGAIQIPTDKGYYYWTNQGQLLSFVQMQTYFQTHHITPKRVENTVSKKQLESWEKHEFFQNLEQHPISPLLRKQGLGMHFQLLSPEKFKMESFISTLEQFQCHAKIGEKIALDLINQGERVTTTRYHLLEQWDRLEQALLQFGVELTRTWPQTKPVQIKLEQEKPKPLDLTQLKISIEALQNQYKRIQLK